MDTELTNKAYLAGLKLKKSGLSEELIYVRLEKQGFPEELSRKVARDVFNQAEKESAQNTLNYGLAVITIGFLIAFFSSLIFTDYIILPIGLIIGGVVSVFLAKTKLSNN
jgi:hypothetical protein